MLMAVWERGVAVLSVSGPSVCVKQTSRAEACQMSMVLPKGAAAPPYSVSRDEFVRARQCAAGEGGLYR